MNLNITFMDKTLSYKCSLFFRKDLINMVENCRIFLEDLILKQKYSQASDFVFNNIEKYQQKEYFVLIYILFQIRKEELDAGVMDIFSALGTPDIDTLLLHYTQIKFCLRRFEYQLPKEICQEALDYFINFNVSPYAIYRIAQFACVDISLVLEKLAQEYTEIEQNKFANILISFIRNK